MRVGITGAAGSIGTVLRNELATDFDVVPFEYDLETKTGIDLRDPKQIKDSFQGLDAVIHLAASSSATASWEDVKESNIELVYQVMEEAVRSKVKRVIFASSNHTQHGTSIDDFEKPESLRKDPPKHTLRDTPIPDTLYGVSKVFGESLGAYYAARFGIEFVALRIGWAAQEHLPTRSERDEYLKSLIGSPAEAYMRSILLSREDCASVFTRALLVPLNEKVPFMVAYAMSDNTDNIFDMSETREKLGYIPQTNAEDRFKNL